jgi:hypothetical protein
VVRRNQDRAQSVLADVDQAGVLVELALYLIPFAVFDRIQKIDVHSLMIRVESHAKVFST